MGREAKLRQLHGWFAQAQRGARQVVFVTGEVGIGKTTVVEACLASLAGDPALWLTWGQCLQHYGAGEAYLPVLDALGRLCRGPEGAHVLALLAQQAPTWLLQLPALLSATELEAVQRRALGATRERMLRELAETLEVLTVARPLVLVLEDLHWSDTATLDLVAWLARRREPARLLVLGTYRPVEVIAHRHPLQAVKQDLSLHGQCAELRLESLPEAAVAAYLAGRFPGQAVPPGLTRALHRRTDGQPLFLVAVVDEMRRQGWVVEGDGPWPAIVEDAAIETLVPESLRELIEQQYDGLGAEAQQVLEAASVAGVEFSAAAVAAGVESAIGPVEECCADLARQRQFLEAHGVAEWPDGTLTECYQFRHALYQQVVYDRVPRARRVALHHRRRLATSR